MFEPLAIKFYQLAVRFDIPFIEDTTQSNSDAVTTLPQYSHCEE